MKGLRAAAAVAALAWAVPCLVHAQEQEALDSGWELGGRVWTSTGKTQWSHNAQSAGAFYGNPTSVLVYDRLNANSLELQATKRGRGPWFVSGYAGVGSVHSGVLTDSDYAAGQVKISETTSSISNGDLGYFTVDGGWEFLRRGPRTSLALFGGVNWWHETVVASGASFNVPAGTPGLGNGTKVITNEMTWTSFRVGLAGRTQLGDKFNLSGTVAAVPYTSLRNEDSHHLRTDLGSTPNITMDGTGFGIQLDGEARYTLFKSTDIGLGLRYWRLRASGDIHFGGSSALELKEFESTRYGATLSIITRW